jgi:hypothetical protein
MKLPDKLVIAGFSWGMIGSLLFYLSPMSWPTYESRLLCPWCAYIDFFRPVPWTVWLRIGSITGLLAGLALAVLGAGIGFLVQWIRK